MTTPTSERTGRGLDWNLVLGLLVGLVVLSTGGAIRELGSGCSCTYKPWMVSLPFAGIVFYLAGTMMLLVRGPTRLLFWYLAFGLGTHAALIAGLVSRGLSCYLCAACAICCFAAVLTGLLSGRTRAAHVALAVGSGMLLVGPFAIP